MYACKIQTFRLAYGAGFDSLIQHKVGEWSSRSGLPISCEKPRILCIGKHLRRPYYTLRGASPLSGRKFLLIFKNLICYSLTACCAILFAQILWNSPWLAEQKRRPTCIGHPLVLRVLHRQLSPIIAMKDAWSVVGGTTGCRVHPIPFSSFRYPARDSQTFRLSRADELASKGNALTLLPAGGAKCAVTARPGHSMEVESEAHPKRGLLTPPFLLFILMSILKGWWEGVMSLSDIRCTILCVLSCKNYTSSLCSFEIFRNC